MITLRQVEIFVAVVRHGSFRRCSEELGLSQVVVGEHIRILEERLGAPLFERRPGAAAKLTAAGERAYLRAIDILGGIADLMDELSEPRRDKKRNVTLALPAYLMGRLQNLLDRFATSNPTINLNVDFSEHSIAEIVSKVERREIDIGLFFAIDAAIAPRSLHIGSEPLSIFVAPSFPWAQRDVVSAAELADEMVIQLPEGRPIRQLVDQALDMVCPSKRLLCLDTEDFGLILTSVMSGKGYGCMFKAGIYSTGLSANLVEVTLDPPLPVPQIRLAARNAAFQDPLLNGLIEAMVAVIK